MSPACKRWMATAAALAADIVVKWASPRMSAVGRSEKESRMESAPSVAARSRRLPRIQFSDGIT